MLTKKRRMTVASIVLMTAGTLTGWPAAAASKWCFEDIGCPADHFITQKKLKKLSCQNLRHVRNSIYDQNGYCFRDKELADIYDNKDCIYESPAAVPLNRFERRNVTRIVDAERAAGCK